MAGWAEAAFGPEPSELTSRVLMALAAYQPKTALLYWRHLPAADRAALPEGANDYMVELDGSTNERVIVAAALAERLGLPRI